MSSELTPEERAAMARLLALIQGSVLSVVHPIVIFLTGAFFVYMLATEGLTRIQSESWPRRITTIAVSLGVIAYLAASIRLFVFAFRNQAVIEAASGKLKG